MVLKKFVKKNYIFSYFKSFISLFIIYFKSRGNKKIIFFYFPVKAYYKNIIEISKRLEKNKNFNIFLIYNTESSELLSEYHNSYLLDFNLLKYLPFHGFMLKHVILFFSSYVNYVFPPNSKNIYICHDIADAPMANNDIEARLFLSLSKLDYIFLSSENVVNHFKNKFYQQRKNLKNIPKLINTGYLKLDHVIKKLSKINSKKNQILIAPTFSKQMNKYNMSNYLIKIIEKLIKNGEKVIFRPHPLDLTKKGNLSNVNKIIKIFNNFENFKIDKSVSYIDSYSNSKLLITDFSGTAYTYTYSTLRPVIFFSKNEIKLRKSNNNELFYFKDRKNVGFICTKINQLSKIIKKIDINKKILRSKIFKLRKKRIRYVNISVNKTVTEIMKIYYNL
tara:strand:+ start:1024 stop:2196 length:1173 start_codon:yes stop_codon:yes gene_type:complete